MAIMTSLPKSILVAACVVVIVLVVLAGLHVLTITAFLTLLALIVSIFSLAYQIWRTGLVQSADLLLRFEHDFFGPEKLKQRSLAAGNYLKSPEDFHEMEDILDFFETIAMLTRKQALDLYMVWHTFNYWIERYYAVAQPYIKARQKNEPGVWADLAWLAPKLRHLESKAGGRTSEPRPETLKQFLNEEKAEG